MRGERDRTDAQRLLVANDVDLPRAREGSTSPYCGSWMSGSLITFAAHGLAATRAPDIFANETIPPACAYRP